MIDHSQMKLGKRPALHQPASRLMLRNYIADLAPPPVSVDWSKGIIEFGMMLNDQLGDCTIAAVGHAVQVWSANSSNEITVPDSDISKYYSLWDGYDPNATLVDGQNPTDQGGVEVDVLNDWHASDFAGVKLLGYADPSPQDALHVKQAVALFGGLYIGLALPLCAQTQAVWDFTDGPLGVAGSWGGHAVWVLGYDADGLTCVTWGQLKRMTWAFWLAYCDESHALVSNIWAPPGIVTEPLLADVNEVSN